MDLYEATLLTILLAGPTIVLGLTFLVAALCGLID
jgi:hypothetical protein